MNIEIETWIDSCYDAFLHNIDVGDLAGAEACIGDMHDTSPRISKVMTEELLNTPISQFAIVSPYENC